MVKLARDGTGGRQRQHCTGVALIMNTIAGLHWSGHTGPVVATIRDTIAGLYWCGDTGTGANGDLGH